MTPRQRLSHVLRLYQLAYTLTPDCLLVSRSSSFGICFGLEGAVVFFVPEDQKQEVRRLRDEELGGEIDLRKA